MGTASTTSSKDIRKIKSTIEETHRRLSTAIKLLETKLGFLYVEKSEGSNGEIESIISKVESKLYDLENSFPTLFEVLLGKGWDVIESKDAVVSVSYKIIPAVMHVRSPRGRVYQVIVSWNSGDISYQIFDVSPKRRRGRRRSKKLNEEIWDGVDEMLEQMNMSLLAYFIMVQRKDGRLHSFLAVPSDARSVPIVKSMIREIIIGLSDLHNPEVALETAMDAMIESSVKSEKIKDFLSQYADIGKKFLKLLGLVIDDTESLRKGG